MINDEGQPLGVISLEEALDHAEKAGLDLVEVSANANPPVCKIMDYGKYRYKQSKKFAGCTKKPNGDSREGNPVETQNRSA